MLSSGLQVLCPTLTPFQIASLELELAGEHEKQARLERKVKVVLEKEANMATVQSEAAELREKLHQGEIERLLQEQSKKVRESVALLFRVLSRIFSLGEKILKGMVGGGLQS